MATVGGSTIAIVGNVKTDRQASAEAPGREIAKEGFRNSGLLRQHRACGETRCPGYVARRSAGRRSIQARYPLRGQKPAFPEQQTSAEAFDLRPDYGPDWETSFYQSINEVDGVLLMGGASTMSAGLVARGHQIALLPLARFGGKATKIWETLRSGRDLPTADEISLMARPDWADDRAADCVKALKNQVARKADLERQRRL
jgi:hypothetical protein